ncbi:hypothetical protein WH50_03980 [Pokkaliibacter plantistimulans]|uniref:CopG family transcriptional regulator n=2 Tax=Pseudomonadota TaxID=1224 RepID=A0ABX5M6P0_9GAMM|nr:MULTISPECIES: hypothetical protein [Pokkaliibacter]MDH2431139.1 hypothetical protein [Pokkaliibacter sp. MBI-7]PPC76350.1 hypothetical protein C4K68_15425 [Pokkaliibacter plantistimulans]PXF32565.1 hypothetical protein WH50_03980 [Pokkaliibacter plantistimulans]
MDTSNDNFYTNIQLEVPVAFIDRCRERNAEPARVLASLLEELVNLNPHFHKEAHALFMEAFDDARQEHSYLDDRDSWS